jgi:tetratricopeptide (TPR) repeat protein
LGIDKDFHKILDRGLQHAKRAVELDERNEYAHWICGLLLMGKRDHESAILQLKRSVELNPNCSLAYGSLGTVLSYAEHAEESILNNKIAIRSNPKDRSIFFRFASITIAHFISERYEQAAEWARKTVSRKPKWDVGHIMLVASLYYLDQPDSAKIAAERYLDELPTARSSDVERLPFRDRSHAEHIMRALLQVGVPE